MITSNDIECKLRELGLKEEMYVEVHSSLSGFGYVDGGAKTIISVLQTIVTPKGAIIMSSFPMSKKQELTEEDKRRGVTCKIKILDPHSDERTGMGVISDTFRKMPDVRTGKGLFRVSAWGAEQDKNSEGYSNLHLNDGYGLLLGVDIYSLTSMHYVESRLPTEIAGIFKPSHEVQRYYPKEHWFIETGKPPEKAWYKIQDQAYRKGYIKDIMIGYATCMFFNVNDVINLYKEALIKDAFGLYGIEKSVP
ncbi:AAC(3) family N-acetyltransferase [Chloroflexota bacterium]